MDQIRNLNSLQIFLAVSELKSVSAAARALTTSQSAVSYHIKKLEDDLGVPLFDRRFDGLEPTAFGSLLASHVGKGFAEIRAGLKNIASLRNGREVCVAMVPMFASRWLAPRIAHFWEAHSDVQLSFVHHGNNYTELPRGTLNADMGVQWGLGRWPGFTAQEIFADDLVVVCSPVYLERTCIRTEADLAHCRLLHVNDHDLWGEWFGEVLGFPPDPRNRMLLEDRSFQLSSTLNGVGVSLMVKSFVQDELAAGTLVNPLGRTYPTQCRYYLVQPENFALSGPARKFRSWLLQATKGQAGRPIHAMPGATPAH